MDYDEKVKYDLGDPTVGYLSAKVVAGTGITLSEGIGVDENKLKITADAPWLVDPVEEYWDITEGLPPLPEEGDRYISDGEDEELGWYDGYIYEWDGEEWVESIPEIGWMVWLMLEMVLWVFMSGGWREVGWDSYWSMWDDQIGLTGDKSGSFNLDTSGDIFINQTLSYYETGSLHVAGINDADGISLTNWSTTNAYCQNLQFMKAASNTIGTYALVADGEHLGKIEFLGANGTGWSYGAVIAALVDGTPGAADMPTRITFSTSPDGSVSAVDRWSIRADGSLHSGTDGTAANAILTTGTLGAGATTVTSLKIPQIGGTAGKFSIFQGGANTIDLTYTLPTAYPVTLSGNLRSTTAGVLSWDESVYLTSVTAHNLLSATHGDTVVGSALLGDLIYADATPNWTKLAGNTTTTKKFLRQTGTGAISAVPAWDTVLKADVGLTSVEDTALSTWAGTANITTLGTIATGIWNGTDIAVADGGTGLSTMTTAYGVVCAGTTATGALQVLNSLGNAGEVLTSNGAGALPTWQAGGGGAPANAHYLTNQAEAGLSAEINLGALATGLLYGTVAAGVSTISSIAVTPQANADGFQLAGGTASRTAIFTGANMTFTGAGANTYTFPASSCTLLGNIVEDTTPQLGGELDLNSKNMVFVLEPGADATAEGLIATVTVDTNTNGIGSPLALATDGHFDDADADSSANCGSIVLALETGTGSKKVLFMGIMRVDAWNWTLGTGKANLVYLSTTAGTLTQTQPSGTDDVVQPVGWAITDDCIFFNPSLEYFTHV